MKRVHVTEIFETESAKRFRLEYFPFYDLVDVRRAIVTPSYNPLYYKNVRYYRISKAYSGTGADQIIVYTSDDKAVRAEKSGMVVIENLTIYEVV